MRRYRHELYHTPIGKPQRPADREGAPKRRNGGGLDLHGGRHAGHGGAGCEDAGGPGRKVFVRRREIHRQGGNRMSGGRFQYQQYSIWQIAEEIQHVIDTNEDESINEWGDKRGRGYMPEVIARLQEGVRALRIAYVYAQRADWLLSDDDSEESFLRRLGNELGKIQD